MKYIIFAAPRDEINSGWVWLKFPSIPSRSIVKITNLNNFKKIYCEALNIDRNFLYYYNQSPRREIKDTDNVLVINEWYRKQLGNIETKSIQDLEIVKADNICGRLKASLKHPQVIVRLALCLALISVGLGILSIIGEIFSLF